MNRAAVEAQLAELPLAEYVWFETAELEFSERIRTVCRENCPRYNKTWACPPAVGSVEACRARCLSYPQGLLITSLTEVADIADTEAALATRGPHEELTRQKYLLSTDGRNGKLPSKTMIAKLLCSCDTATIYCNYSWWKKSGYSSFFTEEDRKKWIDTGNLKLIELSSENVSETVKSGLELYGFGRGW